MDTPFTVDPFLNLFAYYNLAVWPMQIVLYLLALFTLYLAIEKKTYSDLTINLILAFFWLWMGIMYHLTFFSAINNSAYLFGFFYTLQAVLFLFFGVNEKKISFKYKSDSYGFIGTFLIVYALIIYPIIGYSLGHIYPESPTFGVPCPTTIFTFGILLWTDSKLPKGILVIPFLWSIVGFSAALNLTIKEDYGLFVAGLMSIIALTIRDRKSFKS